MSESNSDDLFKRIQDIQEEMKRDGFSPLEGDTHLSHELEFAVASLARMRYRGYDTWKVCTEHRFNNDGIQVKSYVIPGSCLMTQFTPEEAIAIASAIAAKGLKPPEEES